MQEELPGEKRAQQRPDDAELSIQVVGVAQAPAPQGQTGQGIILQTTQGDIPCLYHTRETPPPHGAVLWVWGARGGFDGPADGVYGSLAKELTEVGIASLRLDYRMPGAIPESVMDTLAGASFLKGIGFQRIALVGHSFGGAVVIAAAPFSPVTVAVAALSSQTYGATNAAQVSPRPLLLIHGQADTRLPASCSERIYEWAQEPKELVLMPGGGHGLRECKEEVHRLLRDWLTDRLQVTGENGP